MGLGAITTGLVVLILVLSVVYAVVSHFRSRSEHQRQLDDIRRKLAEKEASQIEDP